MTEQLDLFRTETHTNSDSPAEALSAMDAKAHLRGVCVTGIVVHAPAHFDVLLAASLLRGDQAI